MSNIPNNGENDKSLRDDLDRLGDAYGQLQHEEPPEMLDQAILNTAHRAVEKKPRWMQFGWLHGLTTAAVFVLAISLVFNQREQVPVYEGEVILDESMGLQREKAAKMRSRDTRTGDLRMELKEDNATPGDVLQASPVSAPTPDEPMEAVAGDRASEPAAAARGSTYKSEQLQVRADNEDRDITADEPAVEEVIVVEADSIPDAPVAKDLRKQSQASAIVFPAAAEAETTAETDDEIEQQLLAIMKMKESGDEAWLTELALFKQEYPDYPLPDELSN